MTVMTTDIELAATEYRLAIEHLYVSEDGLTAAKAAVDSAERARDDAGLRVANAKRALLKTALSSVDEGEKMSDAFMAFRG